MLARSNEEFNRIPTVPTPYSLRNMRNTIPTVQRIAIADLFEAELLRMSQEDIFSADDNPVEYLYPWAHIMASDMVSRLQDYASLTENFDMHLDNEDLEHFDRLLQNIHEVAKAADELFQNLLGFPKRPSRKMQSLTHDYKFLLHWAKQLIQHNTDHLNRKVGQFALRESQKSIELANSVKILSELAFIFLPLTFSAALFGMNITELGIGKSHLWIYVLTAVGIGGVTFLLWWFLRLLAKSKEIVTERLRGLWLFACISPSRAFFLSVFCLLHLSYQNNEVFRQLGIGPVLIHGSTTFEHQEELSGVLQRDKLSAFWSRKIQESFEFTSQNDWHLNFFHKRLFSKFRSLLWTTNFSAV